MQRLYCISPFSSHRPPSPPTKKHTSFSNSEKTVCGLVTLHFGEPDLRRQTGRLCIKDVPFSVRLENCPNVAKFQVCISPSSFRHVLAHPYILCDE